MNTPHPYLFIAVIVVLALLAFFSMYRLSAHASFTTRLSHREIVMWNAPNIND